MRLLDYIREPRRLSLAWRAGLANAAVFAFVFILFVVTPVTVHAPPRLTEVLVLAVGLGAMLVVNLLLLRRALAPLGELGEQMEWRGAIRMARLSRHSSRPSTRWSIA